MKNKFNSTFTVKLSNDEVLKLDAALHKFLTPEQIETGKYTARDLFMSIFNIAERNAAELNSEAAEKIAQVAALKKDLKAAEEDKTRLMQMIENRETKIEELKEQVKAERELNDYNAANNDKAIILHYLPEELAEIKLIIAISQDAEFCDSNADFFLKLIRVMQSNGYLLPSKEDIDNFKNSQK